LKTLERWLFRSIEHIKAKKQTTKFLITPGGFSLGAFPDNWNKGLGWQSSEGCLELLLPYAIPVADQVISERVIKAAKNTVKYITLNVDLRAETTAAHAELVAVFDVNARKIVGWTGKSYPTMKQENKMVHITNPATHLFDLGEDRAIILGCHDLNIFNGRARANQKVGGPRHKRCQEMLECFQDFNPTHVIQHPHGTDTWKSWNASWRQVNKTFPGASWASAITYAAGSGKCRAPLKEVLSRTHHEGSKALNVVIRGREKRTLLQDQYIPPLSRVY
jgi:hypothetical protein